MASTQFYFLSSDIQKNCAIKINSLRGRNVDERLRIDDDYSGSEGNGLGLSSFPNHLLHNRDSELFISVSVTSRGSPVGLPSFTSYRSFSSEDSIKWNEWISFPVSYGDLSHTSRFVFTIFQLHYTSKGQALKLIQNNPNITFINQDDYKSNNKDTPPSSTQSQTDNLNLKPKQINSSNSESSDSGQGSDLDSTVAIIIPIGGSSIPMFNKKGVLKLGRRKLFIWAGVMGDGSIISTTPHKAEKSLNLDLLEKAIRRYDQKDLPCVKWLDKLALRRIEKLQHNNSIAILSAPHSKYLNSNLSFFSGFNPVSNSSQQYNHMYLTIEFPPFKHPVVYDQKACNQPFPEILPLNSKYRLTVLHDPEMLRENPIELKYHKLARASKGAADRDLKPGKEERKELANIISAPNKRLTTEAKELLWRFRFSLVDDKRALTKFVRCVNWQDEKEVRQALDLLDMWTPPDIQDALDLLSHSFTNAGVRTYATKQLSRADNDDLYNYLLQLVQALRYEGIYPNPLSAFLISRCIESLQLANFFHWFLRVEIHDNKQGNMFLQIHNDFLAALKNSKNGSQWAETLAEEETLIDGLMMICEVTKKAEKRVDRRIEIMKKMLAPDGSHAHLKSFKKPICMAVRPNVFVTGIIGDESTMFKSQLTPLLLTFNTSNTGNPSGTSPSAEKYKVIFKSGDDLRQDQLIIQFINLMDVLLKRVKLDLCLTPYRVLATGPKCGFVEYVPHSHALTSILDKYDKDIRKFFEVHNQKPALMAKALDNFVKSCAGYCVITYILGIGDRHLDNVMLTTSGHLFHIDFGFCFGRDPKPFPPPMKFCKEMVEAMGGASSNHYEDFRRYSTLAFNILRQHASLIINLLSLMQDANIQDLSSEVDKKLAMVQEKFRLDLQDDEAGAYILTLIDQSASALFPQVMEKIHKWALYWK